MGQKKLMLIDGNSLLFRAFYALPLLHTSDGIYTNGVYGFLTMLNRVREEQQPSHIVVAFDKDKKTFRTEIYEKYKANRTSPPDELKGQFQLLREVINALNITYIEKQGFEADDIIGTLSKKAEEEGIPTVIVTGDGDALQLVSDKVTVLLTRKGITEIDLYGPAEVLDKWGVSPNQMIDIKALMGDASDNIPGVPGIGAKTAMKLIKKYGDLSTLYQNLDQIKGKKSVEKLSENKDIAFLSRQLATIDREVSFACNFADYELKEPHKPQLIELYKRLQFNNFLKSLNEEEQPAEIESKEVKEKTVLVLKEQQEILDLAKKIKPDDLVCFYFKVNRTHPMWAEIQGIYWDWQDTIYFLPVEGEQENKLSWLKVILETDNIKKILHNAKFVQVLLMRYDIQLNGIIGDTLLSVYVDDPSFEGDSLSACLAHYMKVHVSEDETSILTGYIKDLYKELQSRISDELHSLLNEVEMPLSQVLAKMEHNGIKVERDTLKELAEEFSLRIAQNQEKIFQIANCEFNINSPKQLGKVLFEDLGLKPIKKTKTGYATGAEVLEQLFDKHEIIPYILNYRQLTKLKSTYVDALQNLIHPQTGRVHTIFKQAQTATGRLSSVEPNLQNIPIRVEEGRRIRKAFVARDNDWVLVSADYSQIDLRSLAHISGDDILIETFAQEIDIHTRTAAEIFNVPMDQVDSELRRRAKAVNFGIIYGISEFGLARDTGVSRKEAREYIKNYLDSYPRVKQFMEDIVEFGKEKGYVETILMRRRYLPDLKSKNKTVQAFARRMALNTPVQGTSADIIKLAMIKVAAELENRNLQAQLLLQVHDDLLLEVPKRELDEVVTLLRDCMENAYTLRVPLRTTIKTGPNWYDMQEID